MTAVLQNIKPTFNIEICKFNFEFCRELKSFSNFKLVLKCTSSNKDYPVGDESDQTHVRTLSSYRENFILLGETE